MADQPTGRMTRRISTNKHKLAKLERELENLRRAVGNLQELMTDMRMRVRLLEREHAGS